MRLTHNEKNTIVNIIQKTDPNAKVYLFGSRIDDGKLGGDIDILIHSSCLTKSAIRQIKWQLMEQLGEQKIDILLSQELKEPFVRLILPEAIKLK